MTIVGIIIWATTALAMIVVYAIRPHRRAYPHHGYLGLVVIVVAEVLLFRGSQPVGVFFTAIAWTGYIAAIDAAVYSLAGESLLHGRSRAFLAVLALSAPFWLLFEAYNLRLHNWVYVNLPRQDAVRYFGYAWAFSTIWPAMLETAYFLRAAGLWTHTYPPVRFGPAVRKAFVPLGAAMLIVPLVVPVRLAAYGFGLVWLGFIFLLDPINSRLGGASLMDDLEAGNRSRLYSLMAGGLICGIFWEFWNYWAIAKWIYIFPILQNAKLFEMPIPGFLGFPPFAAEYFCVYVFLAALVERFIGVQRLNYVPNF